MNVNLKITKKLYRDKMAVALFVTPYFGMELNIKL